jgi:hypothetical protein
MDDHKPAPEAMSGKTGVPVAIANPDPAKTYNLPVDSEHKAVKIKLYSFAKPHMRAFHLRCASLHSASKARLPRAHSHGIAVRTSLSQNAGSSDVAECILMRSRALLPLRPGLQECESVVHPAVPAGALAASQPALDTEYRCTCHVLTVPSLDHVRINFAPDSRMSAGRPV